ncbi:MAG: hypothetical protein E7Y34_01895, partial [Mycoplasma sp.]|nr:hypothetical protein [Mycoplasma sp.]
MDFQPKRFKKIKRIAISTSLIVSLFSVSILITGYKTFKNDYNAPKKTKIEYVDKHKDRIQSIEDIYKSLDKIDLKKELPFFNKSILDFFKNIKLFDSNYLKKIKTKFDEIKTKVNEFPKSTLEKLSFANFKKYNSLYK